MGKKKKSAYANFKNAAAEEPVVEEEVIPEPEEEIPEPEPEVLSSLEHTDESVRIENELDECYEKLEKCDVETFYVGLQKTKFDMHDPLFEVKEKTTVRIESHDCACCKLQTFHTDAEIIWCEWCGSACCDECVYKTRAFPVDNIEELRAAKKPIPSGKICKLCDRKLLGKAMI